MFSDYSTSGVLLLQNACIYTFHEAEQILTTECVLLLQNVSSYYRMRVYTPFTKLSRSLAPCEAVVVRPSYYRMCSLTTERVLFLQNVSSYYRTCSLPSECVLLLQNACIYTFDEAEQILSPMRGRCRASLQRRYHFVFDRLFFLKKNTKKYHQTQNQYQQRRYHFVFDRIFFFLVILLLGK